MSIIKNKLIQMILVGLLFAFILGILSFAIRGSIVTDKNNLEKQKIIIDVYYKNKINDYLNKLNEIGYLERTLVFSQELYRSLEYIKLRHRDNKEFGPDCFSFKMNLTDNSIFIETSPYSFENKKLMSKCVNKLFDLSFQRLKEKLNIFNYQAMTLTKFQLDQEISDEKKKNDLVNSKTSKNIISITNQICRDLDNVLKEFDVALNPKSLSNEASNELQTSFLTIFTLQQNLIAAKTLEQFCELRNDTLDLSFQKKEFIFHLNELNKLIKNTKFNEIYKVEKIHTIITRQHNVYLSKKSIVITFSIFGFIFGALLVYNFRSSKNKNE